MSAETVEGTPDVVLRLRRWVVALAVLNVLLLGVLTLCAARGGVPHLWKARGIDQAKFEPVYRAGKALGSAVRIGLAYVKYGELLQAFSTEVSIAKEKARTELERELVNAYADADVAFYYSRLLWTEEMQQRQRLVAAGLSPKDEDLKRADAELQSSWVTAQSHLSMAEKLYNGERTTSEQPEQARPHNAGMATPNNVAAINSARADDCRTNRQSIEWDIIDWSVDHPNEQPTIEGLQASGLHVPTCPEGGRYSIEGRIAHCSVHP